MSKETRKFIKCDICAPSTRPGLLWMRGSDWVECPQCQGTGKIEIIKRESWPTGKIFIPGYTHGATINKDWTRDF